MNMRFVETFVWLARLRNFRLTAEKLHTTQAAVSSRIATLEQELGVRLFDRGDREVALTSEGAKALVYAERLVRTLHDMLDSVKDPAHVAGVVRLGVIETVIHAWFPELMARLHRTYPQLEVELAGDTTIRLAEQFGRGHLDVVLSTDPMIGANVQNLALCDLPMRCAGATRLDLHGDVLTLADLAQFPILSFSRHSGPHRFVQQLFDDRVGQGVHINCMTSVAAMVRMVVDGFGVALLPPAIIRRELSDGDVHLLRLDTEMPQMPLICSYRAGPESPLFQQIAVAAQQCAQDFARSLPSDMARLPTADLAADPWTLLPRRE